MSVELHKVDKFFKSSLKPKIQAAVFSHERFTELRQANNNTQYSLLGDVCRAVALEAQSYDANNGHRRPVPRQSRVALAGHVPATNYNDFCNDCATVCSALELRNSPNIYIVKITEIANVINLSAKAAVAVYLAPANYYLCISHAIFSAAQALGLNGGTLEQILAAIGGVGTHDDPHVPNAASVALIDAASEKHIRATAIGGGAGAPCVTGAQVAVALTAAALAHGAGGAQRLNNAAVRFNFIVTGCAIAANATDIIINGQTFTLVEQINLLLQIIGIPRRVGGAGVNAGTAIATADTVHGNDIAASIASGFDAANNFVAGSVHKNAFITPNGMSKIVNNFYRRIIYDADHHGLAAVGAAAPYDGILGSFDTGTRVAMCDIQNINFFTAVRTGPGGLANINKIKAPYNVGGYVAGNNLGIYCQHFIKYMIGYYFNDFLLDGQILTQINNITRNSSELECIIALGNVMQDYFTRFTQYVIPVIKSYGVTEEQQRMTDADMIAGVFVGLIGPGPACIHIPQTITQLSPALTEIGIDKTNGDITITGNRKLFNVPGKYYVPGRPAGIPPAVTFGPNNDHYKYNFHLDEHDPMVMAIDTISVYIPLTVNMINVNSMQLVKTPGHQCVFFKTPLPHRTARGMITAQAVSQINADGASPQIIETPINCEPHGNFSLAIVVMFSATAQALFNQQSMYGNTPGISNRHMTYRLEDDGSISILDSTPNTAGVSPAVPLRLPNFHYARQRTVMDNQEDIWNETCKAFFGTNSSAYDKWCGPMLFHVFHKTGLNMLKHISETNDKAGFGDVFATMKNANASIHYEILKTLEWIGESKTDGTMVMVNVDTWLDDIKRISTKNNTPKGQEFTQYFNNKDDVKNLLQAMVENVNSDPRFLEQKYAKAKSAGPQPASIRMTQLNNPQKVLLNNRNLSAPMVGRNPRIGTGLMFSQLGGAPKSSIWQTKFNEVQQHLSNLNQRLSPTTIRHFDKKIKTFEKNNEELEMLITKITRYTALLRGLNNNGFANQQVTIEDIDDLLARYSSVAGSQDKTTIKLETAFGTIYATMQTQSNTTSSTTTNDKLYVRM
jgi:hypothetical protein